MAGTPILGALTTASAEHMVEAAAMEAEAATSAAAEAADRKHRVKSDGDAADDSDEVVLISWRPKSSGLLFQGLKVRALLSWCLSDMSVNLGLLAFGLKAKSA